MSDDESRKQRPENDIEGQQTSKSKPKLVDATHKLKAEALRRLQLRSEESLEAGESSVEGSAGTEAPQPVEEKTGNEKDIVKEDRHTVKNSQFTDPNEDVYSTQNGKDKHAVDLNNSNSGVAEFEKFEETDVELSTSPKDAQKDRLDREEKPRDLESGIQQINRSRGDTSTLDGKKDKEIVDERKSIDNTAFASVNTEESVRGELPKDQRDPLLIPSDEKNAIIAKNGAAPGEDIANIDQRVAKGEQTDIETGNTDLQSASNLENLKDSDISASGVRDTSGQSEGVSSNQYTSDNTVENNVDNRQKQSIRKLREADSADDNDRTVETNRETVIADSSNSEGMEADEPSQGDSPKDANIQNKPEEGVDNGITSNNEQKDLSVAAEDASINVVAEKGDGEPSVVSNDNQPLLATDKTVVQQNDVVGEGGIQTEHPHTTPDQEEDYNPGTGNTNASEGANSFLVQAQEGGTGVDVPEAIASKEGGDEQKQTTESFKASSVEAHDNGEFAEPNADLQKSNETSHADTEVEKSSESTEQNEEEYMNASVLDGPPVNKGDNEKLLAEDATDAVTGEKDSANNESEEQPVTDGDQRNEDTESTTEDVVKPDDKENKASEDSITDVTTSVNEVDEKKDKKSDDKATGDTEEGTETNIPEEDDTINLIPDDFYYNVEDFISRPIVTENVPMDLLTLHHSFGYECTKRSNLYMLDSENVFFAVGNFVQILNIKTKNQIYIRSLSGGGIGAVVIHPSKKYFAVAEKGVNPYIAIYEYPSLKLYRILREGTEQAYSHLDFSPNGEKLASVGSYPDFMLTVWDWRQEKVVLRSKAFSQDVYKVAFSPEDEGHLCSSGTGHIRFWTMASTFTGLKLQGELGRFGTTELSDIAGFVELPDGKVLSGSEWGNMLLWDGGLIKVEIGRKGKKFCHQGTIQQFYLDEGELITIGDDGYVKVWDFESIDSADTTDDSHMFEMEPMSELKVGTDVKLMFMVKSENPQESSVWYAQDGNGGIWKLDLSFSHTSQKPMKIQSYHAGKISGLAVSPLTHVAVTAGMDCTVRLFDYLNKVPLCYQRFNFPATSVIWVPKVIEPDAASILAGFGDGVLRHLVIVKSDSVSSKKESSGVSFKLVQVFKPHLKAVTCIAITGDGKFLATGSEDSTVFFFEIGKKYKPIGYIDTGSPVVSLDWSSIKQGSTLLVCCQDGSVLEVSCPDAKNFDTTKTFQLPLSGLKRKEFKFKSIKDELVRIENEIKKAKEEEEKRKQEEEEKRRKRERGITEEDEEEGKGDENDGDQSKTGEDEEEEEEEEEKEEEPEVHPPGSIVKGFYRGENERFWLSMDGWDAGYFYECGFPSPTAENVQTEPLRAIKLDEQGEVAVRSSAFSKSGQFLAMGLDNGAIKVCPLDANDQNNLNSYWNLNVHDNHGGQIMDLSLSYDERFLLTVGSDGNFFIYSFMDEEKLKEALTKKDATIPIKKAADGIKQVDDIEDPNYYSIELEKQKAEYDKMVKLAEEKKQKVRQTISLCRREFKRLQNQGKELPHYLQLSAKEFVIDPEMKLEIEKETSDMIELLKRELAWNSEKQRIALEKIQRRFKDMIEVDRIVLHAFNSDHLVASYRATKLSMEFYSILGNNRNLVRRGTKTDAEGLTHSSVKKTSVASRKLPTKGGVTTADDVSQKKGSAKPGGKISKAIEKADQRRQRRLARQAEWDELNKSKPDHNYEDPEDVWAIKEAEQNIGDFKLKTAKDFVVPESQRVNAEKKRVQLMELQEKVYQRKNVFNAKLLALRSQKLESIEQVKEIIMKIGSIQQQLPPFLHVNIPAVPKMLPEEQPERCYEFSKEQLIQFRDGTEGTLDNTQDSNDDGGFRGGGETGGTANKATSLMASTKNTYDPRGRSTSIISSLSSQPHSMSSPQHEKGSPETIFEEHLLDDQPSTLEMQMAEESKIRLTYERDELIMQIRALQAHFDAELRTLRHEKMLLDVELKNAQLREITLFEELMLLKEFEKRENTLFSKVSVKLEERQEMREKVEECQLKIEAKKEELEKLQEKEKDLMSTFSHTVGENNKFEAFLTKVFKKKIKRAKRKEENAESDEDSDEEESDDDYDSDEEEGSDGDELDDSVCPAGCDQSIFDQVCQLREKRLDLEEAMTEEKKISDSLKKEMDALTKKVKIIDSALKLAEADLEAFQLEKQQKLNELDVVVTLKLSQLQYVINSVIPQDLQECLVFNGSELSRLQRRIKELEKEKTAQKKLYKQRRQQYAQLIRDKKLMEGTISELDEKVKQTQLLKFGRLIDLEKLETVSVNRVAEELKEKLRAEEFSSANEIADWEKKIDAYKAKLTAVTRENTKRLDTYTMLLQENKSLEHQLDSRQKNLGGEFQGNRQADLEERQRLVQLVQLQSQEMEALKDEINLLSRKGGHVLPPSQPPLASSSRASASR